MKLNITLVLFLMLLLLSCERSKDTHIIDYMHLESCSYEEAVSHLPGYEKLILHLLEQDYEFWSFKKYINSNKSALPEKIIVLRHDVHERDLIPAYYMRKIEKELLGEDCSTFFVMLNDPTEKKDGIKQERYSKFISFLIEEGADVQPHISPNDMLSIYYPEDEDWSYKAKKESLQDIFDKNYNIVSDSYGKELIIIGKDVFNLNEKLAKLPSLLIEYNKKWEAKTNSKVLGYAAHGSSIPINLVLNNAVILDLKMLLKQGIYIYDAYNTEGFMNWSYLTDSYKAGWMKKPELITQPRCRMLCHPNQWYQ